jgi:hypothetical protein
MSLEDDRLFEEELRKLRPQAPPLALTDRIGRSLQECERRRQFARLRSWLAWGGMAAAASVLVSIGVLLFNGRLVPGPVTPDQSASLPAQERQAPSQDESDVFRPVIAENNLKGRIDEGIVFLRNGLTARRYRYEFIDRVVWENPDNGALIELEIPRDEVVLVPVQTF